MSSRVRKQNEPMKAFVPVSSLLVRGSGSLHCAASGGATAIGSKSLSATLSPPLRHISPEHVVGLSGNRSPGALTYKGKVGGGREEVSLYNLSSCAQSIDNSSEKEQKEKGWATMDLWNFCCFAKRKSISQSRRKL